MNKTDACINELKKAGLFDSNSDYDGMLGESVKELLLVFQNQGHSGFSAAQTAKIFYTLIKGDPLSPLTDNADEWMEVSPNMFQNTRVSHVFWNKNTSEGPYTIDGKAFSDDGGKSYWTGKDSSVYFSLPGFPPKTEYAVLEKTD